MREALRQAGEQLAGNGRVLLRESGTEPVVRVMAEAGTVTLCEKIVDRVVAVIRAEGLAQCLAFGFTWLLPIKKHWH